MESLRKIVIELVSGFCNAKCVWCMNSYESTASKINKGFMYFESFRRFIDINPPSKIIPFSHGEPLLNPDFRICVAYARERGWKIKWIHTNFGMELSNSILNELTYFESITINIGGGSNETHKLNIGTDLKLVADNMQRLYMLKLQNNSNLVIKAKMLINKNNYNEIDLFKKRFRFADLVEPLDTLYFGCSDGSSGDKLKWLENNYDHNVKIRENISVKNSEITTYLKSNRCPGLVLTIRWNGGVNICCRARYGDGIIGNAFKTPIADIIASKQYKEAVRQGKRKEYIEYCRYCS